MCRRRSGVIGCTCRTSSALGAGMGTTFVWDESKALSNVQKHGISFDEAATVFADPLSLTIIDEVHSTAEDRFVDIGESSSGRLLVVVYTEHDETIRIISCRSATKAERSTYEQQRA